MANELQSLIADVARRPLMEMGKHGDSVLSVFKRQGLRDHVMGIFVRCEGDLD